VYTEGQEMKSRRKIGKRRRGKEIGRGAEEEEEEEEEAHLMSVYQIIHDPPSDTAKVHWSND
jgi:hypothetical protein